MALEMASPAWLASTISTSRSRALNTPELPLLSHSSTPRISSSCHSGTPMVERMRAPMMLSLSPISSMASAARTAGLMILRRIVLETGLFSGFLSGSSFGLLGGLLGLLFSTPLGSRLMAVIVPIRRVIVVGRHISRTAITARYTFLDSPSGAEERSRAPIFVEIFFRLHVANEFVRPVEAILLSSCRLEVKALCVATAIPLGFGSQEWLQLTRILDIPTKQHGMIFMLRVMAMLHVSTPEFSETQGNRQITTTIIHPTHSVDILATPLLPIRRTECCASWTRPFRTQTSPPKT